MAYRDGVYTSPKKCNILANILYHLRSSRTTQKICSAVIFIPKAAT
nr:MAG TPA_asm: hypothetical protein [Caudoviricetes sp.]DAU80389.1 MAG TPA: hypothetical protein [Caudoviricetes sp.]DAV89019.1 MAG TPA: hypothetical protein [Caudoviricetes sp.]